MARRRADIWDDLTEVLRWLFTAEPPGVEHTGRGGSLLFHPGDFLSARRHNSSIADIRSPVAERGCGLHKPCRRVCRVRVRQQRATFLQQNVDISWLNNLSWQDFERQVAEVYRQRGYQVDEVGGGGADGGVDLRLRRDGTTAIVQCKRWKTYKVGVKPVRELFGVMTAERAGRAIFISSGIYTDEALAVRRGQTARTCRRRNNWLRCCASFNHPRGKLLAPST